MMNDFYVYINLIWYHTAFNGLCQQEFLYYPEDQGTCNNIEKTYNRKYYDRNQER